VRLFSERSQIKGMLAGDRLACEEVISRNYESVYRFIVCLCGDRSLAEDLTQETFVSAWAEIERFRGNSSITTWLHRIAYNKFIDSKRRLNVQQKAKATLSGGDCSEGDCGPDKKLARDEEIGLLREAIGSLESGDRTVVVLRYIEGFRYGQVAEILQKPVGTIKWQSSEALKKLRIILSGRI